MCVVFAIIAAHWVFLRVSFSGGASACGGGSVQRLIGAAAVRDGSSVHRPIGVNMRNASSTDQSMGSDDYDPRRVPVLSIALHAIICKKTTDFFSSGCAISSS